MRLVRVRADPLLAVLLVVLAVALESLDVAVALEGEHVGRAAIEEPAVVGDDIFRNAGGRLRARHGFPLPWILGVVVAGNRTEAGEQTYLTAYLGMMRGLPPAIVTG
jgi:hypothetical protein